VVLIHQIVHVDLAWNVDRYSSCGCSGQHLHASWARYRFSRGIPVSLTCPGVQLSEYYGAVASGVTLGVRSQVPTFVVSTGGGCYALHILPK
jgi:hypothetical protein